MKLSSTSIRGRVHAAFSGHHRLKYHSNSSSLLLVSKMVAIRSSVLLFAASAVASPALLPRQATVTVTEVASAPAPTSTAWNAGSVDSFPIHPSCNVTESAQIKKALDETLTLVRHARDHILRWGNSSEIYQKYFGNASTGEPIGWYTKIADGDKAGVLFRCDNPDGNCGQEGNSNPHLQIKLHTNIYLRMGRPLARRERNIRNSYLPPFL